MFVRFSESVLTPLSSYSSESDRMAWAGVGSARYVFLNRLVAVVMLVATSGSRLCSASPLRMFQGEYLITRTASPDTMGSQSLPDMMAFSEGIIALRENLGHGTHLVSAKPWSGSLSLLSSGPRKLVEADAKDTTCAQLIRDGIA